MTTLDALKTPCTPNWCAGCGNLPLWAAFKNAAVEEGWDNTNTAMVAGIGCHGHILNFTKVSSFEGLHGRPIPVATGIKMANHDLNVFVFTGDGDCLGEGGNHLIHACRRNHDITVILHDNQLYALTTGQTSPTTTHGTKTKSTPAGNLDTPFMPLTLVLASGATFIARAYVGDIPKLTELMRKANDHKGFSFIDVLQPCATFNKEFTHEFFQENTYYLGNDYDPTNREKAFIKSREFGKKKIPLGIFYQENRPSYESQIAQLKEKVLVEHSPIRKNLNTLFKKYT